jgi:glycosyltransferase involved in cell wall biosynthesis
LHEPAQHWNPLTVCTNDLTICVAVCTHNPRADFLARTIDGLRTQTLSPESWDLLIVDNASRQAIDAKSLNWGPRLRVVREMELGLTRARLAAISASQSDLIVFVDDDNVLAPDYLERSLAIAADFPRLGAWGGQCLPDFMDGPPEDWARNYLKAVGISTFDTDHWASHPINADYIPIGAGLVVRASVAQAYREATRTSPIRLLLDRRGDDLSSCGDIDLAVTACDLGYGIGRFTGLRLTHIIPEHRLREEYLSRMIESTSCSSKLLDAVRNRIEPERKSLVKSLRRAARILAGGNRSVDFRMSLAYERGRAKADEILRTLKLQEARSGDLRMQGTVPSPVLENE